MKKTGRSSGRAANPATRGAHYRITRKIALAVAALLGDASAALADVPSPPPKEPVEKPDPATFAEYLLPPPRRNEPVPAYMVVRPKPPQPAPAKEMPDAGVAPDAGGAVDAGAAPSKQK